MNNRTGLWAGLAAGALLLFLAVSTASASPPDSLPLLRSPALDVPDATPTPSATPEALADLIVTSFKGNMSGYTGGCVVRYSMLVLQVCVANTGRAPASAFQVEARSCLASPERLSVDGLDAGVYTCLETHSAPSWFSTCVIEADVTNAVAESNETNNTLSQFLPVPSPPPTCTATASATATPAITPTPTRTRTPTITLTPSLTPTPGATTITPTATPTATSATTPIRLYLPLLLVALGELPPPTATPTVTATVTPSGPPEQPWLLEPPDGALLGQPLPPAWWMFLWTAGTEVCTGGITIDGPGGRHFEQSGIHRLFPGGYVLYYTQMQMIPDDALAPWYWQASVSCPGGSSQSEIRTFSVFPVVRLHLPVIVAGFGDAHD